VGPVRTVKGPRRDLSRYRLYSLPRLLRIDIIINNLQAANLACVVSLHSSTFATGSDKLLNWQLLEAYNVIK